MEFTVTIPTDWQVWFWVAYGIVGMVLSTWFTRSLEPIPDRILDRFLSGVLWLISVPVIPLAAATFIPCYLIGLVVTKR